MNKRSNLYPWLRERKWQKREDALISFFLTLTLALVGALIVINIIKLFV